MICEFAPQQSGEENHNENQTPTHCWRSRLTQVRLRPIFSHGLTDLVMNQSLNNPGANHQRQYQRRHYTHHGAKSKVLEN